MRQSEDGYLLMKTQSLILNKGEPLMKEKKELSNGKSNIYIPPHKKAEEISIKN